MKIQPSHSASESQPISTIVPAQFTTEHIHRDHLVAAASPHKGGGLMAHIKAFLAKLYNAVLELFGMCALEPNRMDIIEGMFYDPKGQAKDFAATFQDNLNLIIQAAFSDPEKVRELIDDNKKKYKAFCKELNKALVKKSIVPKLQELKAAVAEGCRLLHGDIEQETFTTPGALATLKENIPGLGRALVSFFRELRLLLDASHACEEKSKKPFEALQRLCSNYLPQIAGVMSRQDHRFDKFVEQMAKLDNITGDSVISILTEKVNFYDYTKQQDKDDIRTVLEARNLLEELAESQFAGQFGLKSHINYKMTFLQGISAEDFERLLPILTKDESLRKGLVRIFKEIKQTEEPFSYEKLTKALDALEIILGDFESPNRIAT
ncbi:MAG: hypothetical protein JSS30_04800 [Verrucomicrobia bacterium]|nr:hypothetical protein [Verrucomicrobiota bacterium]